ncbi:hypothetical protein FisN_2Lu441 [Fistulifera solaris]|uniref:Uncharacterized protein n=1 Tax=Fistulifera solaris TaxID=1519565 RepID=A0A1Z5JP72_FISSO|nr:hypothetical protein FisN_2Lu441 [Fistulifera solaris]|eukprot:GAX15843.1 hypothetical protein FisN_2Lu441 [Fistulifera solaris]
MKFSKIVACAAPKDSLLALHAQRHPCSIQDCLALRVTAPSFTQQMSANDSFSAQRWAMCFFRSKAFRLESLLLRSIRWCMDLNHQRSAAPRPDTKPASFGSGFFRVVEEKQSDESLVTRNELILDSGPFLTWLAISPNDQEITYQFGTLTKEPNAVIRFLYPFHLWYSKRLLFSGARQHVYYWSSSTSTNTKS